MARAVIALSGDIKSIMPALSSRIEGCAYSSDVGQVAFRKDNMVVVIYPTEINILKIENETKARLVVDWLEHIFDGDQVSGDLL
jgi:ArsR family metal-binding transcriptional regulator